MEFGPDARARTPRQQTNAFAAVSQGQHEQPGPPVLARLWVAHHGATAVVDLRFFPWRGEADRRSLGRFGTTKPTYETLYGLVVAGITVVRNQVLPDGLGIPSAAQFLLDEVPVGLAGADPACGGAWYLRKRAYKVGGHFVGRFCRRPPSPGTRDPYRNPDRL